MFIEQLLIGCTKTFPDPLPILPHGIVGCTLNLKRQWQLGKTNTFVSQEGGRWTGKWQDSPQSSFSVGALSHTEKVHSTNHYLAFVLCSHGLT